jgi:hypothetical protein
MKICRLFLGFLPALFILAFGALSPADVLAGREAVLPTHLARPVALARSELAKSLGITGHDIEIVEVRDMVWPDNCLGVPSPKPCGGGTIQGYRVLLRALGNEFEYHVDRKGRLRFGGPGDAPALPKPVGLARKELAAYLRVPVDRVEIVKVEAALWPNTCLGLPAPELCAPGETPGYQIVLRALGKEFRYHSDRGESIRFAGPGDIPQRNL